MYKKTKYMVYASVVVIAIMITVAFSVAMNSKSKNKQYVQQGQNVAYNIPTDNMSRPANNMQYQLPKNTTMRVTPETRDFLYPEEDPLNSVETDTNEFEKPIIKNVQTKNQRKNVNQTPMFSEYDPFNQSSKQINEEKTTAPEKTSNTELKQKVLYNENGSMAADFDIMNKFSIENTNFYIVGYRPANIQRNSGFTNRKIYIYKEKGEYLVNCFELFERQERSSSNINNLISVSTNSDETIVTFHGANGVTRSVFNSQLLSPYGDKTYLKLMYK